MPEPLFMPATIRERAESDGRTVEVRIMPWDTVVDTPEGREAFARGAFAGTDARRVTIESQRHGGTLVGRGEQLVEHDDAAYLFARVSETPAGDELLTLIRDGVISEASVAFKPVKTRRAKGVLVREAVELWRVAILERGNYPGAGVVALRGKSEGTDVADDNETGRDDGQAIRDAMAPLVERMTGLDERVSQLAIHAAVPEPQLEYRARSLGELLSAVADDPTLNRALVDQITTNNPGVVPAGTLAQVRNIINTGRPTVNAFGGGRPLPSTGMTVNWPRMTAPADLLTIYDVQATEKADIVSALVSFGSGTTNVATYAGGSDISYQLIRRSEPPYLELYAETMLAAWAKRTNLAFLTYVTANATGSEVWVPAGDTDGSAFVAALVNASVEVQAATGSPASFALLGTAAFSAIAGILAQTSVNPASVAGTATAAGLRVNVSGIEVIHEPALGAATGLVSNTLAASWLEDPVGAPALIEADDVSKLGRNRAYWNLGAPALFIPAGVVEFAAVLGEEPAGRTATRSAKAS